MTGLAVMRSLLFAVHLRRASLESRIDSFKIHTIYTNQTFKNSTKLRRSPDVLGCEAPVESLGRAIRGPGVAAGFLIFSHSNLLKRVLTTRYGIISQI